MADQDQLLGEEELAAAQKCGYTWEEALAFKGVYNHYDANFGKGDGKCSIPLVKSMVRALGINMEKKDEDKLAEMLTECDENKDGSTQFPEFLLLIHKMQTCNFCGMNDAAADRVKAEALAKEKKNRASQRRNSEKAAHRASLVYLQDHDIFSTLQEKAANMEAAGSDEEEENEGGLRDYDDKTDGPYRTFYLKNHKVFLDEQKRLWQEATGRIKKSSKTASKTRVGSKNR